MTRLLANSAVFLAVAFLAVRTPLCGCGVRWACSCVDQTGKTGQQGKGSTGAAGTMASWRAAGVVFAFFPRAACQGRLSTGCCLGAGGRASLGGCCEAPQCGQPVPLGVLESESIVHLSSGRQVFEWVGGLLESPGSAGTEDCLGSRGPGWGDALPQAFWLGRGACCAWLSRWLF